MVRLSLPAGRHDLAVKYFGHYGHELYRAVVKDVRVRAQRRTVLLQNALYATVAVLFLSALLITLRKFMRNVRRELELSQLKSGFVADVSHELKTPLALIRMFSETLLEGHRLLLSKLGGFPCHW